MSQPATASAAVVFGCTGLVGSHILSTLLATTASASASASGAAFYPTVHTVSRRDPTTTKPVAAALSARDASAATTYPVLKPTVEPDTAAWARTLGALDPPATTVFSALGTTRAAAGSLAAQWKVDHDLNVELVRQARASSPTPARVFVFVSSGGSDAGLRTSLSPYLRMKRGVQEALRAAGFGEGDGEGQNDKVGAAIVLKPGLIMGAREGGTRTVESVVQAATNMFGSGVRDRIGQDAAVIARAAVAAARIAEQGKAPAKFWVIESAEILRLGRDEWKE